MVLRVDWASRSSKSDVRIASDSATVMSVSVTGTSMGADARNWSTATTKRKKIAEKRMVLMKYVGVANYL